MWARCTNPKHISYQSYGALGVTIDERWRDFDAFVEDMGHAPVGMTLDRRDGNEGYSAANCRWVSPKEQARNRTSNVFLEHGGERLTIAEWAERAGLKVGTLWRRIKTGVPLDIAMHRELRRGKPMAGKQKPRKAKP